MTKPTTTHASSVNHEEILTKMKERLGEEFNEMEKLNKTLSMNTKHNLLKAFDDITEANFAAPFFLESVLNHTMLFLAASAEAAGILKRDAPPHETIHAIIQNIETTYRACSNLENMLKKEIQEKFGS